MLICKFREILAPIAFRPGIGAGAPSASRPFALTDDASSSSDGDPVVASSTHREVDIAEQSISWSVRRAASWVRTLALGPDASVVLIAAGDNKNACRLFRGRQSRHPVLNSSRDRAWDTCVEHNVALQPEWVPRDFNALADALSKLPLAPTWEISSHWFNALNEAILRRFGWSCTVDRFASAWDSKLPCWTSYMAQPGYFSTDALSNPWTLPTWSTTGGNWVFPPAGLVAEVVDILLGLSLLVGFPVAPEQLPPSSACLSSFCRFRSVLLVREFRQQPWFRSLQHRRGTQLLWRFPICGVFFLPYRDYRIPDQQFLVHEGSVLERSFQPGSPIDGSDRQRAKQSFLIFIFDAAHPSAGRIPVSIQLPRLAF